MYEVVESPENAVPQNRMEFPTGDITIVRKPNIHSSYIGVFRF